MSLSISDQILHPTNPTMLKDMNTPKERGQTRVLPDGSLLYLEPITRNEGKWTLPTPSKQRE